MTPQTVALHVSSIDEAQDLVITVADGATVADVLDALTLPPETAVDGVRIESPTTTLAETVLHPGSELTVNALASPRCPGAGFVEVAVVAGLNAGGTSRLGAGVFHLALGGDASVASWVAQVDERDCTLGQPAPWRHNGDTIEVVGACVGPTLVIGSPIDPEVAPASNGPSPIVFHRPPRPAGGQPPDLIEVGDVPPEVRQPAPLSWATLLAPVPIAIMMAVFFRPIFALFAAMGPIMALGRWWESRRRHRRLCSERAAAIAEQRAAIQTQIEAQAEAEARRRWQLHPHVGALSQRALMGSVRLWERRAGGDSFMAAMVGVGPAVVSARCVDDKIAAELGDLVQRPIVLRAVPRIVDFEATTAIGITGAGDHARAVAFSLIAQLTTTHGPADLRIGVLCGAEYALNWDWLKWLPHLDRTLVSDHVSGIVANLSACPPAQHNHGDDPPRPVHLLVLDATDADSAALKRAADVAGIDLRCIAIAPEPTALPAICSEVFCVDEYSVTVEGQGQQQPSRNISPTGISPSTAESWARSLARFSDPECTAGVGDADPTASLLEMIGPTNSHDQVQHWAARAVGDPPVIALGRGAHGPFHINLAADGPHALIAGTTGSGKSELLRTLVVGLAAACSPDEMNLVLVDFKGGGAFDAVRDLPHVVGMITDLDEVLVSRALVSVRAELERRERLFRELAVSSFEAAAAASPEPLARLVIVIDEFAALAADYSELMSGIVDLAARGRSLGMHLVLATQRPSGVVDQKIRANTNIRIALRVQDEFDSQDVVGTPQAAHLDRRRPGSALVRIGGDRPVRVRMAYGGAVESSDGGVSIRAHRLFTAPDHTDVPAMVRSTDAAEPEQSDTELRVVVQSIIQAAIALDFVVRPLWSPPLPDHLDWIDLGSRELDVPVAPSAFALGLADMPGRQVQLPWRWDPAHGALGIYGASGSCAGKALVSLGAAMASAMGPSELHMYVVDGGAGLTSALAALPHTGGCIQADDVDRIERVVRLFETAMGARRSSRHAEEPLLVLLIDNLAAVLAAHDDAQVPTLIDRLAALARDGAPRGVHLAVAARAPRDITHRLAQQIPTRLVMDLADPNGFLALGLRQREVVPLPPMRAIDARNRVVVQLVEPPDISSLVADPAPADRAAVPVRSFPSRVASNELPPASLDADGTLAIPVGIDSVNLDSVVLRLRPAGHALIVATPGMGRTSTAQLLEQQIRRGDIDAAVVRVDSAGLSTAQVQELVGCDRATVLIIDDVESLPATVGPMIEQLMQANNPHVRIVALVLPDAARSVRTWIGAIRACGTGLLLGGTAADGDIFRVRVGQLEGRGTIAGRANLIDRGRVIGVQLAAPNAGD